MGRTEDVSDGYSPEVKMGKKRQQQPVKQSSKKSFFKKK